eukprot:UN30113
MVSLFIFIFGGLYHIQNSNFRTKPMTLERSVQPSADYSFTNEQRMLKRQISILKEFLADRADEDVVSLDVTPNGIFRKCKNNYDGYYWTKVEDNQLLHTNDKTKLFVYIHQDFSCFNFVLTSHRVVQ